MCKPLIYFAGARAKLHNWSSNLRPQRFDPPYPFDTKRYHLVVSFISQVSIYFKFSPVDPKTQKDSPVIPPDCPLSLRTKNSSQKSVKTIQKIDSGRQVSVKFPSLSGFLSNPLVILHWLIPPQVDNIRRLPNRTATTRQD